jgi:hypothetical protein
MGKVEGGEERCKKKLMTPPFLQTYKGKEYINFFIELKYFHKYEDIIVFSLSRC